MDNVETYNRVGNLEAPWVRSCFSASYLILFSGAVVCLVLAYLKTLPLTTALIAAAASGVIAGLIKYYDVKRPRHCHHCRCEIGHITRELLLTSEYLGMNGIKQGDNFYTQCRWGNQPFITRWAKISHRARACHHCRLSEEGYFQHFEPVSAEQLRELKNQQEDA